MPKQRLDYQQLQDNGTKRAIAAAAKQALEQISRGDPTALLVDIVCSQWGKAAQDVSILHCHRSEHQSPTQIMETLINYSVLLPNP